jgi:hypothetical protein
MNERRMEPRYLVKEDAFMWDLLRIKAGYHSVTVVDLSRNGLRLESADQLSEGSQIAVDFRGMIVCGTVRHCRRAKYGYSLGVQINDVLDPLSRNPAATEEETEAALV